MATEITSQTFPEFPETTIRFPSFGGYVDIPLIPEYSTREKGIESSLQGIYVTGPKTIPVYEIWESNDATSEPFCYPLPVGTSWKKAPGTYVGIKCVNENFNKGAVIPEYGMHKCVVDHCSVIDRFPNPKYAESFCTPFEYFRITLPGSRGDLLPYARFSVAGIYDVNTTYKKLSAEGFCILYKGQIGGQPLTIEQFPPKQLVLVTGFYNGSCFYDRIVECGLNLTPLTMCYDINSGCYTYYCNGDAPCVTLSDIGFYNTYQVKDYGKIEIRPTVGTLYVNSYTMSCHPVDSPYSSVSGYYYPLYTSAFLCGACDPQSFNDLKEIKWVNIYKKANGELSNSNNAEFSVVAEYIDSKIPEDILDVNKDWVDVFVRSDDNHQICVDGKSYTTTSNFCHYKVRCNLTFRRTGVPISSDTDYNNIYYIIDENCSYNDINVWNRFCLGKIHFLNITSGANTGEISGYYKVYDFCTEFYSGGFYGPDPLREIEHAPVNYFNTVYGINYDCSVSIKNSDIGYKLVTDDNCCQYFCKSYYEKLEPCIYTSGFGTDITLGTCTKSLYKYNCASCVNYTLNTKGACYGGYLMWYNSPVVGLDIIYNSCYPCGCWAETMKTHATGSLLQVKVDCSYTCDSESGGGGGGSTSIPSYWPVCTPCIYIGPNCGQRLYYGNKLVQEAYWNEQRVWWS